MALDNRFRFDELVKDGSKAIISEDTTTKTHTFVDGASTIVSASVDVPFEHIKGERDGETTAYIEKPAYTENQLKKAVDTVIDELVAPPKAPQPDVVPRPVYDELQDKFEKALEDLEEAQDRILKLEGEVATLNARLTAALTENDSLKAQKAVVDNQFQQSTERYKDQTSKLVTAILKATKEANERVRLNAQVEGLVAQKDVLRQQLLTLRKIVSGLEGQIEAGVESLKVQTEAAASQREAAAAAAEAQRLALQNQQEALESQLAGTAAETAAAAAGLGPLSDNQSYYGIKQQGPGSGPSDIEWVTSVDNPQPGKCGKLTVQNLKDSGAKITQISIAVTGQFTTQRGQTNYGPLGFGSDNGIPRKTASVSISKGSKTDVTMYMNRKIGGKNKPEPDKSNFLNSAQDYRGNFVITVKYDDGTTAKTESLSWHIRKNKR